MRGQCKLVVSAVTRSSFYRYLERHYNSLFAHFVHGLGQDIADRLVIVGGNGSNLSRQTFRPLGINVTVTASANILTPRSTRPRASSLKRTSLAAISHSSLFDYSEYVVLTQD